MERYSRGGSERQRSLLPLPLCTSRSLRGSSPGVNIVAFSNPPKSTCSFFSAGTLPFLQSPPTHTQSFDPEESSVRGIRTFLLNFSETHYVPHFDPCAPEQEDSVSSILSQALTTFDLGQGLANFLCKGPDIWGSEGHIVCCNAILL